MKNKVNVKKSQKIYNKKIRIKHFACKNVCVIIKIFYCLVNEIAGNICRNKGKQQRIIAF